MSTPDAIPEPTAADLRAAAVETADGLLIRYGLKPYSRVCAELALRQGGYDAALAVRGLQLLRAHFHAQVVTLRLALGLVSGEITQAAGKITAGAVEDGLDHLADIAATTARQAASQPGKLPEGVADFERHRALRLGGDLAGDVR